jgi:hypothetical protein
LTAIVEVRPASQTSAMSLRAMSDFFVRSSISGHRQDRAVYRSTPGTKP